MAVSTATNLATRCPNCGKMFFHELRRFDFGRERRLSINCHCGTPAVTAGLRKDHQVWLQVPCLLCEAVHFFYFSSKEFWGTRLQSICCTETGLEIGFFGNGERVRESLEPGDEPACPALDDNLDEYFADPDVMYQVLDRLHDIAEQGRLSCPCGNLNLEVNIFPDRLELQCPNCKRSMVIHAEKDEDLLLMKNLDSIEISGLPSAIDFKRRRP